MVINEPRGFFSHPTASPSPGAAAAQANESRPLEQPLATWPRRPGRPAKVRRATLAPRLSPSLHFAPPPCAAGRPLTSSMCLSPRWCDRAGGPTCPPASRRSRRSRRPMARTSSAIMSELRRSVARCADGEAARARRSRRSYPLGAPRANFLRFASRGSRRAASRRGAAAATRRRFWPRRTMGRLPRAGDATRRASWRSARLGRDDQKHRGVIAKNARLARIVMFELA